MMLAELPSAAYLHDTILTVALVASIGANVWTIFRKPARMPQPLGVEIVKTLVSHDEFKAHVIETRDGMKNLDMRITAVDRERRESVSRVYKNTEELIEKAIEATARENAELRGQMRTDVGGLHDRFNQLLAGFSELKGAFAQSQKKS